jgi:hypothetical protein
VPTLGTNRSGRFPKPVRPIWYSRPHPPKSQKCKRNAQAPS